MKKYIEWGLVLLVIVFAYFAFEHKSEVVVSPVANTVAPEANEPVTILPTSFRMEVLGDFNDPLIFSKYSGSSGPSATIWSSGGEELEGETPYYYSVPGTDGYLVLCEIKDGKWIANTTPPKVCQSLSRLATRRTELFRQITSGELKPIKSGICKQDELCYELK